MSAREKKSQERKRTKEEDLVTERLTKQKVNLNTKKNQKNESVLSSIKKEDHKEEVNCHDSKPDNLEKVAILENSKDISEKVEYEQDFFKKLIAQEANKSVVGTIHSKEKAQVSEVLPKNRDWECPKRGCNTVNFRTNTQCIKCKAMRRISEWR